MKSLIFTGNGELTALDLSAFPNIETVNVAGNQLTSEAIDPKAANILTRLKSFNASNNPLVSVPAVVLHAASTLQTLNLSKTGLSGDGLDFSGFATLEDLNLSGNALDKLTVNSALKKLDVSNNKLLRVEGIGKDTKVTMGKQEYVSKNVVAVANEGLNMASRFGMNFGLPTFDEKDWTKVTDIVWEQLGDGSTYKKVDHGQKAYGDSNPATFLFYSPSEKNIFQSGTYRVTIKYNGAEMVISNIKVTPAKFGLDIVKDYIKVTKDGNTIADGNDVYQGNILIASIDREGFELDKFVTDGLVEEPKSSVDENHIAFRVAGYWNANDRRAVAPSIDATLKDALLTVTAESNVDGEMNTVSIVAQKEEKTINIQNNGKTEGIPYQSKVVIKLKADVGYTPELTIDGDPVEPQLKENSTTEYEYVIEELVKDNTHIVANVVKSSDVRIGMTMEGEIKNVNTAFVGSQIQVVNNKTTHVYKYNDMSDPGYVPGTKATINIYLTKDAVDGTGSTFNGKPIVIDQILYGSTEVPFEGPKKVTEPTDAAVQYTASFDVLPTGGTITIVTKVAPAVTINPVYGQGISDKIQVHTYDGTAKAFEYKTNPVEYYDDVKVQYKKDNNDYTDKKPVEAGDWKVRYWMESTSDHQATTPKEDWIIRIKKAVPEITAIPKVDVQNGKYVITGGEVKFNGTALTNGHFRVVEKNSSGEWQEVSKQETTQTAAHLVHVGYFVMNGESSSLNENFEIAVVSTTATINGQGEVDPVAVSFEGLSDKNFGIEMFNGDFPLENNETVPTGATVKVKLTVPANWKNIQLYANGQEVTTKTDLTGTGERIVIFSYTVTKPTVFKVKGDEVALNKEFTVTVRDYETIYNGEEQAYPETKEYLIVLLDDATTSTSNTQVSNIADLKPEFSYAKVENGSEVAVKIPKDAGTYKVYVTIPYPGASSGWNEYKESKDNVGTMVIKQAETTIVESPKPTLIPQGQTLEQSNLIDGLAKNLVNGNPGDKTVAGTFKWADDVINTTPEDGKQYDVVFVPDNDSYAESSVKVKVTVSDKNLITIKNPGAQVGSIVVTDAETGKQYFGEEEITPGTKLRIQVTPTEDFKLEYVTVNGETFAQSDFIYTVTNSSVAISAEFSVIEPDPEFDPDTQYLVTVMTTGRGFVVEAEGENAVKREDNFSFTVKALAADMSKIVVKTSRGETLTPKNGVYTIEKVTENMRVDVSLPNPTEIKVEIPAEYENEGGYKIGSVQVEGSADGKYYYGDVITVIAIPVDGTDFEKWSDGSKEQVHEITLYKDTSLKASFSGVPTGIEDIESAAITTAHGFIMVKNVAKAKVTVVSISGRLQAQEEVSGDTRIDVPQGVYVVVLESGSDVKRVKVIVK
ncbi:MAG TPA: T9SS type A sorting domain-containing protein [Candidatus Parabacteroides intestinavium]|nr:T9SS type A sorting domain-containing protein [Candidatus Parabacteroides intestinavium]